MADQQPIICSVEMLNQVHKWAKEHGVQFSEEQFRAYKNQAEQISALEAQVRVLNKALRPFAEAYGKAEEYGYDKNIEGPVHIDCMMSEIKAAHQAIAQIDKEKV